MAGAGIRDFVSQVLELAVADSARAWLTVTFDTAFDTTDGLAAVADPPTLIAVCRHGRGQLADGRLTGRWPTVVGARYADWVLLPAHVAARDGSARQVLVSREDANIQDTTGLAGAADVAVSSLSVDPAHVFDTEGNESRVRGALGAAAVVVGSADGLLLQHIRQLRTQLAVSSGTGAVTDAVAAQIARAASDIDAAKLQITESMSEPVNFDAAVASCRQAVARARSAADHVLEHSRHALDASDPATRRWRDVDASSRLAVRVLDGLGAPLG